MSILSLSPDAHIDPPHDDESLDACRKAAHTNICRPDRWSLDFLGLQYRTLCLPKELVNSGFSEVSKIVDLATMRPLDPHSQPDLASVMDFATRASVAGLMLYRIRVDALNGDEVQQQRWSGAYYAAHLCLRAEQFDMDAPLDDLRFLAATCTFGPRAGAPKRDWSALMADDIKWCMVAPREEWPFLVETYPQTSSYLEAFSILSDLVSPKEAMCELWQAPEPTESLPLPDLAGFSP